MRTHRKSSPTLRQRGQILILTGITLIVLIGAVGLAVDTGRAYGVKAKLNSAVDAASIAAARALAQGSDDTTRVANAQAAAVRFFNLNYPADFLGSTPSAPSTSAVKEANGRWRVRVSATADMPTTFIRVLGQTQVNVAAMGETIRRDLDAILVMDTSGSLGPPTSPSSTFPTLKQAAITGFIDKFNSGAGGDRVGLVSFSSGAVLDVPIDKTASRGFNRTTVVNGINALPLGGATASAEGMRVAVNDLNAVPAAFRSSLRVILFFSDGAPNLINGSFYRQGNGSTVPSGAGATGNLYSETVNTDQGGYCPVADGACRMFPSNQRDGSVTWYSSSSSANRPAITHLPLTGSAGVPLASFRGERTIATASGGAAGFPYDNTRCNLNRAARNMVENLANTARGQEIRVYTIGLGDALNKLEIGFCGYGNSERGANILKRLANSADSDRLNSAQPQGLYCYAATAADLDRCFSTIASEILRLVL
jgi:Flp pilus assembly protein TadG